MQIGIGAELTYQPSLLLPEDFGAEVVPDPDPAVEPEFAPVVVGVAAVDPQKLVYQAFTFSKSAAPEQEAPPHTARTPAVPDCRKADRRASPQKQVASEQPPSTSKSGPQSVAQTGRADV